MLLPGPDWFSSRYRTAFFQSAHWWCTQTVCRPVHLLTKSEIRRKNTFTRHAVVAVLFDQFCSATTAHIKCTHSTSLVLWSTVRMTLFGLRADGDPDRPRSLEISWLNKLSSVSDTVDGCGRETAETWEPGCKLEIWWFLAATDVQTSKRSPVSKDWGRLKKKKLPHPYN